MQHVHLRKFNRVMRNVLPRRHWKHQVIHHESYQKIRLMHHRSSSSMIFLSTLDDNVTSWLGQLRSQNQDNSIPCFSFREVKPLPSLSLFCLSCFCPKTFSPCSSRQFSSQSLCYLTNNTKERSNSPVL